MRLQNKWALVTGASRGIGKAIALKLAEEGASVIVHFHQNENEARQVAEAIEETGRKAFLLKADLKVHEEVLLLADKAWELSGGIDCLVNNAGVSHKVHFLDCSKEEMEMFFNTNLKGAFYLTQSIAKKMVTAGRPGSVLTITSINGIQPGVGLSVYGASKGALETLMKGAALELAPHQISVNTLAVGAIQTDMNAAVWKDENQLKKVNENIPMGRFGQPGEVASLVADVLASSGYMTGCTLVMDGGWLLKHGYQDPKPYKTHK